MSGNSSLTRCRPTGQNKHLLGFAVRIEFRLTAPDWWLRAAETVGAASGNTKDDRQTSVTGVSSPCNQQARIARVVTLPGGSAVSMCYPASEAQFTGTFGNSRDFGSERTIDEPSDCSSHP